MEKLLLSIIATVGIFGVGYLIVLLMFELLKIFGIVTILVLIAFICTCHMLYNTIDW